MTSAIPVQQNFFFSDLIFATAQVAYITAMIVHLFVISSAVQIYDFHIFIIISSPKRVHKELTE